MPISIRKFTNKKGNRTNIGTIRIITLSNYQWYTNMNIFNKTQKITPIYQQYKK